MLDRAGINARLKKIDFAVKFVRTMQRSSLADFTADPRISGATERYLQVAAQCCIDIGVILLAWKGNEKPTSYTDLSDALVRAKIFNPGTMPLIDPLISLRNSLVVGYLEIEPDKLHSHLQSICEDIDSFVRFINSYLQKIA